MSGFRKLQSRVTSFLLALTILLTSIPSVSAYTDASTSGTHGGGSATSKGTNFDGDSFIRVTLLFAENGDWKNSAGIKQIGSTIDLYNPKAGPQRAVTSTSNFSSKTDKPGFTINANTATAYNSGESVKFGNYGYEHMEQYWGVSPKEMDNGQTLEFPILIGAKANGVNPKTFFSAKSVINQMLYVTQYAGGTYGTDTYLGNPSDIMDGIYRTKDGKTVKYGQFMFLLESGIYLNINGQYSATTTREAAQLDSRLSYVLSNNIAWPYRDSANNLYINDSWPMLKLDGTSGANSISSFWQTDRSLTNRKFGVGIVTFKSISKPALPVVNYYYDLTEDDLDRAGLALASDGKTVIVKGDETETPVSSEDMAQYYSEVFNRKADNAKSDNPKSLTEHEAPATEGEYQLAEGYMTAKEVIGGYLKVDGGSLQFFDEAYNLPGVTNRLKAFLQDFVFTDDDIKNWCESRKLALTTEQNAQYSKLTEKHIQKTENGGLIAKYGEGVDKLQAVFLYYKAPFTLPPPPSIDLYDDEFPIPNRITHVTKMYFDDKDATEPTEIKTEQISPFHTYEVKNDELNGESYKMTEWVIVADDTPKQPEPYTTWEEAKEHKAERDKNEGTTTGPLGPTNWSDPDSELFIKYVKQDGTNVTKMYYNKGDSTPERIETEVIFKDEPYDITDEEEYKVVDWVIIEDVTPNTPEPYPTYDEAKQHITNGSGTTPGKIEPDKWNDPDSELFIKYEKEEDEPQDGSLRLTEKRISWLKSLEDIGGIPTITFQWAAITGHEIDYDGCGTAESPCPGHSCNEHIGKDSFLRFVSSNTTPVKSDIMGNKSGFMPYDENNVYEFNRGDAGGSYDMHPNYWYVIWRGKDIPTIASYKYDDTTGSGNTTSAPYILNLFGENMVGIKPAGARHPNNNSFYMDSFTITEGKSNYDTGNLSAFEDTFGAQEGGLGDQAFANTLDEYHDISEQYEKAEGDVKLAEEEKNKELSAPLFPL